MDRVVSDAILKTSNNPKPERTIQDLSSNSNSANQEDSFQARINVQHSFQLQYRGTDKSLARPGRKQARKHDREARAISTTSRRDVIKLFFLQGKAPKEIHAIMTETLTYFLPGRAKDLSAPVYYGDPGLK